MVNVRKIVIDRSVIAFRRSAYVFASSGVLLRGFTGS